MINCNPHADEALGVPIASCRWQTAVAALAMSAFLVGCSFVPMGPQPHSPLGPAGENRPAPELEDNPMDPGPVIEVTCTVQGNVLTETEETRRCREDTDCELVCR